MTDDGGYRVQIKLDREDYELLLKIAREEKLPKVQVIRRALRLYRPDVRMPRAVETPQARNGTDG
jgi:hypothetical protein